VAAYDQLLAEGYVFGRTGSGTYVSTDLLEAVVGAARRRNGPKLRRTPARRPR